MSDCDDRSNASSFSCRMIQTSATSYQTTATEDVYVQDAKACGLDSVDVVVERTLGGRCWLCVSEVLASWAAI